MQNFFNPFIIIGLIVALVTPYIFFISEKRVTSSTDLMVHIIRTGTSFGECLDYCYTDVNMTAANIKVTYRNSMNSIKTNSIEKERENTNEKWQKLVNTLDRKAFESLPAQIGCPDYADGGAEWIEIIYANDTRKKITFEYNSDIPAIKDFLKELRAQRDQAL
jgi:hypothetical protein